MLPLSMGHIYGTLIVFSPDIVQSTSSLQTSFLRPSGAHSNVPTHSQSSLDSLLTPSLFCIAPTFLNLHCRPDTHQTQLYQDTASLCRGSRLKVRHSPRRSEMMTTTSQAQLRHLGTVLENLTSSEFAPLLLYSTLGIDFSAAPMSLAPHRFLYAYTVMLMLFHLWRIRAAPHTSPRLTERTDSCRCRS